MVAVRAGDQVTRVGEKLRRELGRLVLTLMDDYRTEDIVLNPDGRLWVYRMGEGFVLGWRDVGRASLQCCGNGCVLPTNGDQP